MMPGNMSKRWLWVGVAVAVEGALFGCRSTGGANADGAARPGPHVVVASPAASTEPPGPAASESEPDPVVGVGLGCAPVEPIKSTDACKNSTDCAPSALCHARSCVDKTKAPVVPDGGVLCTMNLICGTIDVGRCDCIDGVCALVGR